MESNYCGFIEVWKTGNKIKIGKVYPINQLDSDLDDTIIFEFRTVAIFKIKLKQKTNERY